MAVHTALGQPNAPVGQGANVGESLKNFKMHVLDNLLLLRLVKHENCVPKGYEKDMMWIPEKLYAEKTRFIDYSMMSTGIW